MNEELNQLTKDLEKKTKSYSGKVNNLYNNVMGNGKRKELEFPLLVYVDDNFRENFLKSSIRKRKSDVVMLNDASELSPEDKIKLNEMLKEKEFKEMSAQDIVDSVGGRR